MDLNITTLATTCVHVSQDRVVVAGGRTKNWQLFAYQTDLKEYQYQRFTSCLREAGEIAHLICENWEG